MDTSFFPYADIVGFLQSRCHEYLSPQRVQKDSKILSQLVPCTWVKTVLRLHNNITFLSLLNVSSNEEIGWLDMRIPFHQPVFHKASRRRIDKFSRIVDRTELPAKRWKWMGCNDRRMIWSLSYETIQQSTHLLENKAKMKMPGMHNTTRRFLIPLQNIEATWLRILPKMNTSGCKVGRKEPRWTFAKVRGFKYCRYHLKCQPLRLICAHEGS